MNKVIYALFFIIFLTNCSKGEQNTDTTGSESPLPQISIPEIDGSLEKKTNLTISISGTNELISTTVLINENEVISTTQKVFDIEINPFDYPNGKNILTVKSVAPNNKESVKSQEFEIKKLLFKWYDGGRTGESLDSYMAINVQSTGELVAVKKILTYGDAAFYAEDDFIEEDIIVTQYILDKNFNGHTARMYGYVKPGTELISSQEMLNQLGLDAIWPNRDSTLELTMEGDYTLGLFSLVGWGYSWGNSVAPKIEIKYDEELTSDVFLYYQNQSDKNITGNYRYAYIDNLTNQTLQFDEMSTVEPSDIVDIELPASVVKADISLLGYPDEYNYREEMARLLFGNYWETEISGYTISYPNIKEYPIIDKSTHIELINGNNVSFHQRGTLDITIPNQTFQKNDSIVQYDEEYDFSYLSLIVRHPNPENYESFRLIYKNLHQDSITIPFESFEIPNEIVEFLNGRGLEIDAKNNTGQMDLRLQRFENKLFPTGVFFNPIRRVNGDSVDWVIKLEN